MNIHYLIKFTKKEWAEDIKNHGRLFFNPAFTFWSSSTLSAGQHDKWDSHINFNASHIVIAPVIGENRNELNYASGKVISEHLRMHFLGDGNKKIPICCFRIVYDTEVVNGLLQFTQEYVEKIKKDFNGYCSFARRLLRK